MGSVIVNPSHCDWERYVCTCDRGDSVVPSDQDPYSALADIKHKIGECYRYRHLPSPDYNLQSFTLQLAEIMGVSIETISPGDGVTFPKIGDNVAIHYVGKFLDGSKFDSSRDRGEPMVTRIGVGKVIKGWDEGVPQLSLGQKAILTITPDYAYGRNGYPPIIPANSTLKFEVELLKIN